jgi:hypothetical protein
MGSFWTSKDLEPKRSYRWIATINFQPRNGALKTAAQIVSQLSPELAGAFNTFDIPPFLVKSFSKPSYTVPVNQVVDNMGTKVTNFVGVPVWSDVEIEAYDAINATDNVTKIVYEFLRASGWKSGTEGQTGGGGWSDTAKALENAGDGDLVTLTLDLIDSEGKAYERWKISKPVLKEFNYGGTLDYESDAVTTVKLVFAISGAVYEYIGES